MKKLINILGAALLITSLTSCDSLLDMSPEDTMSPETYFSSTRELKLWTDGFYSQLEGADDVIGINADDNIDTELGALLCLGNVLLLMKMVGTGHNFVL